MAIANNEPDPIDVRPTMKPKMTPINIMSVRFSSSVFAASGSAAVFYRKKAGDNGNGDKGQYVAERLFDNLLLMLVKSGKQVKNTDGGCCAGNASERQVTD